MPPIPSEIVLSLAGYLESAACDRGNIAEYWELRRRLRARESALADAERRAETQEAAEGLRSLTPGTVIWLPGGRRRGLAAVIGPAGGRDNSTGVLVLTEDRRVRRVAVRDLGGTPVRVGKVAMPRQLSPKSPRFKSYVARALSELDPPSVPRPRRRRRAGADDPALIALREQLRIVTGVGGPRTGPRPDPDTLLAHRHVVSASRRSTWKRRTADAVCSP